MSLAECRVDGSLDPTVAGTLSRSIPERYPAPLPPLPRPLERAVELPVSAGRARRRLDDALFCVGLVSLLAVMTFFLYVADPLLHHDVNTVWHAVEIGWAAEE